MAYTQNPGNGSLFPNDKKDKDSHPDLRGSAVLPDGTEVWLSAWNKKSTTGTDYISVSIQVKGDNTDRPATKTKAVPPVIVPGVTDEPAFDDEIPF